jgi:hypothetical protein
MELNIVNWTPNFSKYIENLNYLPNGFKNWIIDIWNKIYYWIKLFWGWLTDYLSYICNRIIEILKGTPATPVKGPIIDPSKGKYGDIYNKEYIESLVQTLDEYKFYILITIGVVAFGILTYTYWDSIKNIGFKRGNEGGDDLDLDPIIPSPIPSDPSSGRDTAFYPEGYLTYFSKKLGNLAREVKARAEGLYSS